MQPVLKVGLRRLLSAVPDVCRHRIPFLFLIS
jgi:hypothetical protein